MPNHNAAVPAPELVDREVKVLELRRAGLTWSRIAEQTGYADHTGAYAAYKRAIKRTQQEPADQLRDLELERVDRLQLALWPKAMEGDTNATNTIIRLMQRRADLLGLDAPKTTKLDAQVTTVFDGGDLDDRVRHFAYLIAEARHNNLAGGHSVSEQVSLEVASEAEPITSGDGVEELVDPIGARMGEDENGGGVDSLPSIEQTQDEVGGSSGD